MSPSIHPAGGRALGLQPGILPLNQRDLLFLRVALENWMRLRDDNENAVLVFLRARIPFSQINRNPL